jgi:hypothetical protein
MVRSDNGTEYMNRDLQNFFTENGILHETSCVGTPQQNGVAERKNKHLLEITRSLLFESKVPVNFWDSAVPFVVYLMNRMPTIANNFQTPLQAISSHVRIPSVLNLPPRIFSCSVYVHIQKQNRNKLESRAEKCVFLGCGQFQKGYKCYNPSTKKIYVTMDVTFLEEEAFFKQNQDLAQGESVNDQDLNDQDFLFLETSQHPIKTTFLNGDTSQTRTETLNLVEEDASESVDSHQDQTQSISDPEEINSGTYTDSQTRIASSLQEINVEAEDSLSKGVDPNSNRDVPIPLQVYTRRHTQVTLEKVTQTTTPPVSLENEPQVRVSEQRYILPPRKNRGIPPNRYVPGDGTSRNVDYLMSNYTSTELLPKPLKAFAHQLSSITVPELISSGSDINWVWS